MTTLEATTGHPVKKVSPIREITQNRSDLFHVDPRLLQVKPGWNVRDMDHPDNIAHIEGLALSIAEVGVKQPLTVYAENDAIYISDGHCRFEATMLAISRGADIKTVPVQMEGRWASEGDRVFSIAVRNSGKTLGQFELAKVFKRLIDFGWSESDIAAKMGMQRQRVLDLLGLQAAPAEITHHVTDGTVSATMAIHVLRSNGGDTAKATEQINAAVATAHAAGKKKALPKHIKAAGEKTSFKKEMQDFFRRVEIVGDKTTKGFTIKLTGDDHDWLMESLGFTGKH